MDFTRATERHSSSCWTSIARGSTARYWRRSAQYPSSCHWWCKSRADCCHAGPSFTVIKFYFTIWSKVRWRCLMIIIKTLDVFLIVTAHGLFRLLKVYSAVFTIADGWVSFGASWVDSYSAADHSKHSSANHRALRARHHVEHWTRYGSRLGGDWVHTSGVWRRCCARGRFPAQARRHSRASVSLTNTLPYWLIVLYEYLV